MLPSLDNWPSATGVAGFGAGEVCGLGLVRLAGEISGFTAGFPVSEFIIDADGLLLAGVALGGFGFAPELAGIVSCGLFGVSDSLLSSSAAASVPPAGACGDGFGFAVASGFANGFGFA